jgi:SPP1 family predicted phage head-tail adaptor
MKKAKIYIGQLDQKITLQRGVKSLNALNETVWTWEDVACVWARIKDSKTGSGEAYYADTQVAIGRKEMTIRYRADVDETWRVVYRCIPYDILSIQEPEIRTYQTLICEKRGNAAATETT